MATKRRPSDDPSAPRGAGDGPHLERLSKAGKRAFFEIADRWQLSPSDAMILLGGPSKATFYAWKRGEGRLSRDTLERISYILGIYKALQILLPQPERADAWIKKPNEAFGGRSALDRMLGGNVSDLNFVRQYLDHVRGGRS